MQVSERSNLRLLLPVLMKLDQINKSSKLFKMCWLWWSFGNQSYCMYLYIIASITSLSTKSNRKLVRVRVILFIIHLLYGLYVWTDAHKKLCVSLLSFFSVLFLFFTQIKSCKDTVVTQRSLYMSKLVALFSRTTTRRFQFRILEIMQILI